MTAGSQLGHGLDIAGLDQSLLLVSQEPTAPITRKTNIGEEHATVATMEAIVVGA